MSFPIIPIRRSSERFKLADALPGAGNSDEVALVRVMLGLWIKSLGQQIDPAAHH